MTPLLWRSLTTNLSVSSDYFLMPENANSSLPSGNKSGNKLMQTGAKIGRLGKTTNEDTNPGEGGWA